MRGVLVTRDAVAAVSGLLFDGDLVLTFATLLDTAPTSSPALVAASNKSRLSVVVEDADGGVRHRDAHVVAAWQCPLVEHAVCRLLSGWHHSTDDAVGQNADYKQALATFLVLKVGDEKVALERVADALKRLYEATEEVQRGREVVVESTPFGQKFFLNSWSEGVVSNRLGKEGCIILTDARASVGSEGGPIFTADKRLLGLVLAAVTWCRGEWVGFTLGVALRPVLRRLRPALSQPLDLHSGVGDDSVVLVRRGGAWGSGVVVDAARGLILTCSHVVGDAATVSVAWCGASHAADVVYRTPPARAFDLALLSVATPTPPWRAVEMRRDVPERGARVWVVGWPMFSSPTPTASRGVVARATPGVLVQTTCCVQSGASGGAVLDAHGALVALVACNARDHEAGTLYPHVNMAVPTGAFMDAVQEYARTTDVSVLRTLECEEHVQKVWRMELSLSKL